MITLPLAPPYRDAIKVALVLQALTTVFLISILDGGTLARLGAAEMSGFWIGAAIVMIRRPRTPSSIDLLYVRWGYLAMLAVGIILLPWIAPWMGMLRR